MDASGNKQDGLPEVSFPLSAASSQESVREIPRLAMSACG